MLSHIFLPQLSCFDMFCMDCVISIPSYGEEELAK